MNYSPRFHGEHWITSRKKTTLKKSKNIHVMPRAQLALYSLLPMIVPNSNAVRVLKRRKFKLLVKSSFLTAPHTPQDDDFTTSSLDSLFCPSEAAQVGRRRDKNEFMCRESWLLFGKLEKERKKLEIWKCYFVWFCEAFIRYLPSSSHDFYVRCLSLPRLWPMRASAVFFSFTRTKNKKHSIRELRDKHMCYKTWWWNGEEIQDILGRLTFSRLPFDGNSLCDVMCALLFSLPVVSFNREE